MKIVNFISYRKLISGCIAGMMIMAAASVPGWQVVSAQTPVTGQVVIAPLFEYPVAPEELPDLRQKSDWLMEHFWDNMKFDNHRSVDQNALNDAFQVYGSAAIYASESKVLSSVASLVKALKGNPVLMLQFAKGAEEAFFGTRAVAWSDELYMPFVDGVLAEKSVPESRKLRFRAVKENLKNNSIGSKFPKLRMTLRDGRHKEFQPSADYTIVEIGNPGCDDCKFSRMKLEMSSDIMDMISSKEVEMVFLVADAVPEDESEIRTQFQDYPENWLTGISYGADDLLDLRMTPSFYLLGKKGEILAKNLDVSGVVDRLRVIKKSTEAKQSKKKK